MFSTKFIAAAAATFSLISSTTAVYDPSSQRNLAMYWGSGSDQYNLSYYCDQPNVDIIPIGFINIFPPQANGLVAETFGNQCWNGNYTGPGYNGVNNPGHDYLYKQCPQLQESLYYCQQKTDKKILLSLGGAAGDYYLNSPADGVYLAEFLWGAYGPYNPSWTGVRPLDRGYDNTDTSETIDFDGFDFDIEQTSPDQQAGYIACIIRLRELFAEHKAANPSSKDYIISGAPQCPLDEPYMSTAIAGAKFDILWIQFYNNGANGCTARNYTDSLAAKKTSGFNYDSWVTKVNAGMSAGAKLYIGLLAGQAASSGSPNDYINAANVQTLVSQYHSHAQFGGVMLYEATVAENNGKFYNQIKAVLNSVAAPGTTTSTTVYSTLTTSSKISSTSSTSSKPTSTSATSSSSSSSTLSSSSSYTSSSSSILSSSSSSSTLSSTSSSSSSSEIPSSTSVPVSSTSTSSDVSLPPTSTPTPTTVPSVGTCSWIGCYSEATSVRALSGATYVNYTLMSVEICSAFCTGYTYFGVEYGGECYCGDSFGDGSTVQPTIDCSQTCDGTPTELCGAGNRLDVYQCGSSVTSSVISSSTSSTVSTSSSVSLTSSSSVVSPTSSSVSSTLSSTSSVDSSTSIVSSTSSALSSSSSDISSTSSSTLSSSSSIVSPTVTSTLSSSSSVVSSSSVSSSDSSSTVSSTSVSDTSSSVVSTSSIYSSSSVSSTLSSSSSLITSSSSVSSGTSSVYPTTSGVYTNSTSSTSTKKSVCTRKTKTTSSSVTLSSSSAPYSNGTSTSISMSGTGSFTPTSSVTVPTSSGTSTSSGSGIVSSSSSSVYVSGSSSVSATGSSSSSTVSGTSTSTGGGIVSSPSPTSYTTSTVYTTSVYTITSCAATVTNCPALIGSVTTETIIDYTTVCPVTATETGKGYPTTTPATQTAGGYPTSSPSVTAYTTSTVYKTTTYTITSCPATVTNCPARIGSVTTEVVVDYTTVCPVTATETYPVVASSSAILPGKGGKVTYTPISSEGTGKTTTLSSTTTSYVTVKYVQSTATIVPVPVSSSSASVSTLVVVSSVEVVPYPTGPASGVVSSVVGTGTGVPVVKGVSTSTYAGVATSSPTSTQFTGAAASVKASWMMGFVAVGLGLLL